MRGRRAQCHALEQCREALDGEPGHETSLLRAVHLPKPHHTLQLLGCVSEGRLQVLAVAAPGGIELQNPPETEGETTHTHKPSAMIRYSPTFLSQGLRDACSVVIRCLGGREGAARAGNGACACVHVCICGSVCGGGGGVRTALGQPPCRNCRP
jgi:hypothetical protein